MGQQQLLLIVLGVLVIGVAVIVGLILFSAQSIEVKKDNIHSDLMTLASMAQSHFRRPSMMKGGGGSFDATSGGIAWSIPDKLNQTDNAVYNIESISRNQVVIKATSSEVVSGTERLVLIATISPSGFAITPE